LVERHGWLVLRTCQSVLGDVHEAQDAFQATFLILSRRGGSLWVRNSLGPWLHRVALRVALRAKHRAVRRRAIEKRSVELVARDLGDACGFDLQTVLHEELDRLPENYRVPVVLCDLEGTTYEDAARRLGCPIGTVKSRLMRGRERLRSRLQRRGLAPGAVSPAALLSGSVRGVVPAVLVRETIETAFFWRATGAGVVSSAAAVLAQGALRSMTLTYLKSALLFPLAVGAAFGGLVLGGVSWAQPGSQEATAPAVATPKSVNDAATKSSPDSKWAWRRSDVYQPPDSARFFPDDPEGGKQLDALWVAQDREKRPDAEILTTVRQGLRRTRSKTEIVRWIGNKYVWGRSPQNPDAIEIMYHASDFQGNDPMARETRSWAIYFGLSVVEPKTPAILHTLADSCIRGEDPNDLSRIAWGTKSQYTEIMAFIKPYLASEQAVTREKAVDVGKILAGDLDARTWSAAHRKRLAQEKYAGQLPSIKKRLLEGNSRDREETLALVMEESMLLIMDDSFVPAFVACANDPSPSVREFVPDALACWVTGTQGVNKEAFDNFICLGSDADPRVRRPVAREIARFVSSGPEASRKVAVDLMARLANDEDHQVRYDTIYYGPSWMTGKLRDDIVGAIVAFVLSNGYQDMRDRIILRFKENQTTVLKLLDEALHSGNPARVKVASEVYHDVTGRTPPGVESTPAAQKGYAEALYALHNQLGRVYPNFALKEINWDKVGQEILPRAAQVRNEDEFGLLVEELVARLEDSHALVQAGTATPPAPDLPAWDPGFACLSDDRGRSVVYSVLSGSPAEKVGIFPGMTLVSANGIAAEDLMTQWMKQLKTYFGYSSERVLKYEAMQCLVRQKESGSKVALVFEDIRGDKITVEASTDCGVRYLPRLPVPRKGIADAGNVSWVELPNRIGYIYVRRIPNGLEGLLDGALNGLGDIKGLIIDVRGNSGGGFDVNTAFRNFDLALDQAAKPQRLRYSGPIALLIDERTISAGEGWASWFIAQKRAKVFGTTSAGASSRKVVYTLTNGLYRVVIPVKAYTGFLDRPIERRGLEPDVEVRCRAEDLAQGKDTVVETAADWLVRKASENNK